MAGESSQHEPDVGDADESDGGSVEVFVVLGEAPASVDPGDGAFDDPASGDDLEAPGRGGTLDHLDPPRGIGQGPAQLLAAVGAVGEDRLKGKGNSRRVWRSSTNRAPSRSCTSAG